MVDLYKSDNTPAPRSQMFEAYDADGNKVQAVAQQGDALYGLSPEEQAIAVQEAQKPPTGEELAMALAMKPDFEKVMTQEEFLRYDDYMKTVETDWIEGIMTGAGMVVDEIGKGLSAMWDDDEKLKRAIPTLAEGFARGTRDMYGLVAQSADPQSAAFKFKALLTGDGTPEERFQQFKEAREFNRRSMEIMEGKVNVTDIDPDLINPEVAQALSYIADPSWLVPFVGQAGKAMGLSMKSVGLAKLSEQIAVVGAMTEHAKRLAMGGMLKVAGAPLSLLGEATTRTISWGADKASDAFSFATGMAYQDARRIVREGGLYGGTVFRVPYMSTISDTYLAGWGAKGMGEALGMLGEGIMGRKRGVFSYAEEALAAGKDVLSPQAKAMLRIINQADPILSYGWAAMDGMIDGAVIGGALGYYSARGEGAAQGIGMGAVMGAGGALMGRGWAGMAREGGIIHQRVQAELEFVKNAMKDVDPEKLAQIETLQELAALHGQDLSWQILGMLKLVPDVKLNVLDSVGFEMERRRAREGKLNGEDANDPLIGLDLDDPSDVKKIKQFYNFEGMVVQRGDNGQITLHINADHYKKFTFGHELFHGVMRASPMQDEFVKDLREKLLGRVTPEGIEFPGVIEPNKMRSFMERYIKAAYSNNPEQLEQRMRALDEAIKAYERDGTLIPGQDPVDARPVLDIMVEEAGAYYFSHMINGKDMDWLYRGGDLGGLRQVIDDAKEGLRNFFESKFGGAGMDFNAARTLHEAFLKGGKEGGKRIRIGALDALMTDIIRRQAGTQEGRMLDLGDMNGEQQRRFRERHGLGDVLQPRKNGGMDNRRRTAAEESARAKQAVDALRAMNDADRTSTTIVEKNGDVTIHGDLSDAELNQLVRVGVMMPTEATRYRLFRDTIANKGKGSNVFGGTLVGESFEVGEGKAPPRLRRSKGDKVPITHREFMPIEMRTEIKLTKGGKGKATFVVTGLDIKNADMRLRDLWHREDVQKAWGGDYNAFAADFYLYLENISDPNGIPSAEYFGGGKNGSYKRNVFHEAFGAAMREGETPFNEPSPTYKGAAGRGEKFVIYSMSLGSIYDVKLRDRNVPYNHSIAYDRIRRNWSPSEMRQEPLGEGEKLTHEATGYSFVKGPNGKWRAYDAHRRVIGVADNAEAATQIGRRSYLAEQDRIAKTVKNFSVNEKTEITAKGWAPAFFSAVEKFVKSGAITPNMSPEQVWARIRKANYAGIRADEVRFLGLEARLLGGDNAHLQNAREMDAKVKELFAYSQRFASEDPAKLARVQEVAANLRRKQMEEQTKGEALRKQEQTEQGFAPGKPIGQAGLDALTKHLQDRAIGLRMVDEGNGYASYVMDGPRVDGTYKILTARSNQRTGVSGHFGDDVVVHIRVDERMDPVTGKKVLVVHEIQANNAEQRGPNSGRDGIQAAQADVANEKAMLKNHEQASQQTERSFEAEFDIIQTVADVFPTPHSALGATRGKLRANYTDAVGYSKFFLKHMQAVGRNASDMLSVLVGRKVRIDEAFKSLDINIGDYAVLQKYLKDNGLVLNFTLPDDIAKDAAKNIGTIMQKFEKINAMIRGGKGLNEILIDLRKNMEDSVGSSDKYPEAVLENTAGELYVELARSSVIKAGNLTNGGFDNTAFVNDMLYNEQVILAAAIHHAFVIGTTKRTRTGFTSYQYDTRIASVFELKKKDGSPANVDPLAEYQIMTKMGQLLNVNDADSLGVGHPSARGGRTAFIPTLRGIVERATRPSSARPADSIDSQNFGITESLKKVIKSRYDNVSIEAQKALLDALGDNPKMQSGSSYDAKQAYKKIREDASRRFDGSMSEVEAFQFGYEFSEIAYQSHSRVHRLVNNKEDAALALQDRKTRLQQAEARLATLTKAEGKLIMQTPQDWVAIGLKMAIRHAAERGISTIVFTDHMGAPAKCGMEYVSASKLYTELIPTLGNGFLRQYNAKIRMPVLPKVYRFGGLDQGGRPIVLGDNGGISWQEKYGMKPMFSGVRRNDGSGVDYQVNYRQSPLRQLQQQDVHMAQMKNNPRLDIPPDLSRVALEEGFFNLSPNEGGEVPPMPRSEEGRRRDAAPRTLNVFPRDREFKRWAGKLPLVNLDGVRHMTAPDNKFDVDSREAYHMLKNGFVITAFHGTPERSHESFENRTYEGTYFVPDEKAAAEYARIMAVDAQTKEVLSKGRDAAYADERTRKLYDTWQKAKGKPGLDAYTFGKPDMYYLRSEKPIVALDIRTGVAENRKIKKVIDRLVRNALDNENPSRAEYREKFEEIISRIEAADMYDISGGGYDSIQNTFVEYAFQEGFDAAVFFDTSIDSYAPTIVMNNAKQSNVKAASNIGAFSEDARFDYSPNEIPKGSKDISELGKEAFATGKNKFNKATGLYFRERETGRWYTASYASEGAGVVFFEPVDLRNKYIETQDDAVRGQIDAEIQSQKIVIRSDTQGLGYRGIENKMNERFDAYSKNEPSAKPGDEVKPDGPDLDLTAIRTNADAIKDALTSLDGLGFTKDETFRLFGRRTAKGRTLGIIDEINAEIDKAKAGEEPDVAKIEQKLEELEEMRDEMQEKQDNTPEGLQETEAYQNREENIDAINEVIDEVRGMMEPPKGGVEPPKAPDADNVGGGGKDPLASKYKDFDTLRSILRKYGLTEREFRIIKEAIEFNGEDIDDVITNDADVATNRSAVGTSLASVENAIDLDYGIYSKSELGKLKKKLKDVYEGNIQPDKPAERKPRVKSVEPDPTKGATFNEWFEWARDRERDKRTVATVKNALIFISKMPSEGYYAAVAKMLLALDLPELMNLRLYKNPKRAFFSIAGGTGGAIRKVATSLHEPTGRSKISLAERIDTMSQHESVGTVIEEVMHAVQLSLGNYPVYQKLRSLGNTGVAWKAGALKLIANVENSIKGKTYAQLTDAEKMDLQAARLAKLILEGTKGIRAKQIKGSEYSNEIARQIEASNKYVDLHEALFGRAGTPNGFFMGDGDPANAGKAGKTLQFDVTEKALKGTKSRWINGYHFGNPAEFLVGLFSDPVLAKLYFDKPPVDLSSLTPKGEPLRTNWRNLASQMIAVAMDFFNGLFGGKKKNLGSQLIEETVVMMQRQADRASKLKGDDKGSKDPQGKIDVVIGTAALGFLREPQTPEPTPQPRQRGRQPTPGGEPIPMGMNQNETGLAVVGGEEAARGNEVGPAIPVIEAEATPLPRRARPGQPRLEGPERQVPAVQYAYPRPATPVGLTPIRWTGDAMAGQGILQSTAGYMVVLVKGKWRVYNPEKQIIAVLNDEEKAKELADRRARGR